MTTNSSLPSLCSVAGSIPRSGRFPGEATGYPLQYSWASLVAQMVKNLPAMRETWVWSLSWKIPWRRAWKPTPVLLPGKSMDGPRDSAGSGATEEGLTSRGGRNLTLGSPIFPSGCEGKLGVALESLQGTLDLAHGQGPPVSLYLRSWEARRPMSGSCHCQDQAF